MTDQESVGRSLLEEILGKITFKKETQERDISHCVVDSSTWMCCPEL